ncbi:hypothetical protein Sjap_012107 [Stephania japonica]|uniref:Uncharacterized protein n=1 Tax=Stephania japonica TaxID=461633 RepID=A0AAP0IWK5_9MAGN
MKSKDEKDSPDHITKSFIHYSPSHIAHQWRSALPTSESVHDLEVRLIAASRGIGNEHIINMLGFGFMDEVDIVNNCGGLIDQIDDFLSFPCEDINGGFVVGGGCDGGFKDASTTPQHAFKKFGLMSDGDGSSCSGDLSSEVYVHVSF